MKIGLWLQDYRNNQEQKFYETIDAVKNSDIDIFVFPETSYTPFSNLIRNNDMFQESADAYFEKAKELAERIGKPTVFSDVDMYGTIFSYYYNPSPTDGETIEKFYIKHTATSFSAFDIEVYEDYWANENFTPIYLKDKVIGLTICYDCNHSLFSRMYGVDGIDILINSTGGNVVYEKWFKYNQVRAIENKCYSLVTMGYEANKSVNSYVFGFGPNGNPLPYTNLMIKDPKSTNIVGTVYVYDTDNDPHTYYEDTSNQYQTQNKNEDMFIESGHITEYLDKSKQIDDGLYILKKGGYNLVFAVCDNEEILLPECVLAKLYSEKLRNYGNKKYVIVNRWGKMNDQYYKTVLLPVLKVRSMENYCAVLFESDTLSSCFQCGNNRTAQVVCCMDGRFGLDFKRMGGPESIWKDKPGMMKAAWRKEFEYLIKLANAPVE